MTTTNDGDTGNRQAGAFNSIMPVFDDLLNLIGIQATSNEVGGSSNEEIVKKVCPAFRVSQWRDVLMVG